MRNIRFIFIGILAFGFSSNLSGQMYLDLGIQYNTFQFSQPLELEGNNITPIPTIGFVFFNTKNHRWKIAMELGFFSRNFKQSYPGLEYTYKFTGSQAALLAGYRILDRIDLSVAANFASFNNNIDGGDGRKYVLGEGFNSYDVGATAGITYYFNEQFAFGARYTHWLFPMLEYTEVGNYGELLPPQNDIYTQTIEVYGRFQFLNNLRR